MRTLAVATACGMIGVLWTVEGAQVQPHPSPGSGVVTVAGTVDIGNAPTVKATQTGEWRVAVANTPEFILAKTATMNVAAPEFLRNGTKYELTWTNGDREVVAVAQVRADGWVRVSASEGERWINPAAARSFQAVP